MRDSKIGYRIACTQALKLIRNTLQEGDCYVIPKETVSINLNFPNQVFIGEGV